MVGCGKTRKFRKLNFFDRILLIEVTWKKHYKLEKKKI